MTKIAHMDKYNSTELIESIDDGKRQRNILIMEIIQKDIKL
jgi:hypothetical protein